MPNYRKRCTSYDINCRSTNVVNKQHLGVFTRLWEIKFLNRNARERVSVHVTRVTNGANRNSGSVSSGCFRNPRECHETNTHGPIISCLANYRAGGQADNASPITRYHSARKRSPNWETRLPRGEWVDSYNYRGCCTSKRRPIIRFVSWSVGWTRLFRATSATPPVHYAKLRGVVTVNWPKKRNFSWKKGGEGEGRGTGFSRAEITRARPRQTQWPMDESVGPFVAIQSIQFSVNDEWPVPEPVYLGIVS